MARSAAPKIGRTPSGFRRAAVPIAMTMVGSLSVLLPFITSAPLMPPMGLIIFLSWRALHRHIWPVWVGLPLGLWDDLFSGAVLGSAMLLWTLILIGYELIDRRMIWRDFGEEWALASLIILVTLVSGLLISTFTGGGFLPELLVTQVLISVLIFPITTRLCAALDSWRLS